MKRLFVFIPLTLIVALLLNACGTSATEVAGVAETEVSALEEMTEPVSSVEEPIDGGTFHYALNSDPDTLDPHKTVMSNSDTVMSYIGASLVYVTPEFGYEPYLAESWTVSEDGLVWDF